MGRPPCCDKANVKRGLWTPEEDAKILAYVSNYGVGNWTLVPKKAGLNRCGKSCRLRWTNYLRPDLKHDSFTPQEEQLIIELHQAVGSRWSLIAKRLPGRTDNDVKNYWNTKLRKKLVKMGIDPITHKPFAQMFSDYENITHTATTTSNHFQQPISPNLGNSSLFHPLSDPTSQLIPPNMISKQPLGSHATHFNGIFSLDYQVHSMNSNQQYILDEVSSSSSSSSSPSFKAIQPYAGATGYGDLLSVENTQVLDGKIAMLDHNAASVGLCTDSIHGSFEPSSSPANSFIEAILDHDIEMHQDLLAFNEDLDC